MSDNCAPAAVCPEDIELLVFRIRDVSMGVDTDQVSAMLKPDEAQSLGIAAAALNDMLDCGGSVGCYEDPYVLVIRGEGRARGIMVDRPREILTVRIDAIRPMPPFLTAAGSKSAVWGAVLRGEECIILIDFHKLLGGS